MSDKATIQVGRMSSTDDVDVINVQVVLDDGEKLLRLTMGMEAFARMVTGDHSVECDITRRQGL